MEVRSCWSWISSCLVQTRQRILHQETVHDGDLLRPIRQAHGEHHKEPVQLGLRQWEGACRFDGVLGGNYQEGGFQGPGDAVDGDLPLLHALQKTGLGPGGGAVDLIRQQNVAEHGARPEDKGRLLLIIVIEAGDVGGQQVRGELDPPEFSAQRFGQGFGQHGFAGAGDVLQQHVAAAAEGCQQQLDLLLLAHDDLADIFLDCRKNLGSTLQFHSYLQKRFGCDCQR